MSNPFKITLCFLFFLGLIMGGYYLYGQHKEKIAAQHVKIQFAELQAWAGSVLKHQFDLAQVFQGCGFVRFDSPDMAGIAPKPFVVAYEFEPSVESCLQDPAKMQAMAAAIPVLVSDGMTEITFIDSKTRSLIIKFSTESGWTNFTQIPIQFTRVEKPEAQ